MKVSQQDTPNVFSNATVYLDDQMVEHCTFADDEVGIVIREKRVDGQPVPGKGGRHVCETLQGKVEIRLNDSASSDVRAAFDRAREAKDETTGAGL